MPSKYHALIVVLSTAAGRGQKEVDLGFDEIATLVQGLPPSARLRQWWANAGHPQAHAWRTAGYRVQPVYLDRRRVRFSRLSAPLATDRRDLTPPASAPARELPVGPPVTSGSGCGGPSPGPWCSTALARRRFPAWSRRTVSTGSRSPDHRTGCKSVRARTCTVGCPATTATPDPASR
ncbi:DUF7662 domain-containing protein [Actinoplanes cyaneus]|uniref:DUF7662 domain-containing protein n=1 Tax=Actinoplanes cyaneus TaxID=52696 RepID=UPI003CD09020